MKKSTMLVILAIHWFAFCSDPKGKNPEDTLFSFRTSSNKTASLCIGKVDTAEYIVYRFGADTSVELEFPSTHENSFDKFFYSYYMRGGEKENEGLDLNSIEFKNGKYSYKIYQEYAAKGKMTRVGISVTNNETGKKIEIKGNPKTVKGSLVNLRFDDRIKK